MEPTEVGSAIAPLQDRCAGVAGTGYRNIAGGGAVHRSTMPAVARTARLRTQPCCTRLQDVQADQQNANYKCITGDMHRVMGVTKQRISENSDETISQIPTRKSEHTLGIS